MRPSVVANGCQTLILTFHNRENRKNNNIRQSDRRTDRHFAITSESSNSGQSEAIIHKSNQSIL